MIIMDKKDEIKKIIESKTENNISYDENFISNGKVDSLKFVEIMIELENRFEITIPDDKLNMLRLNSVDNIISELFDE